MKRWEAIGGIVATFTVGTVVGVAMLGNSGASTGTPKFGTAAVFAETPAVLRTASEAFPKVSDGDLGTAIEATKACVREAVGALGREKGWSVDVTFPDTATIAKGDGDKVAFEWSFSIPNVPQDTSPELESFKLAANVAQIGCQRDYLDSTAAAVRSHRRADVGRLNSAAAQVGRCLVADRSLGLSDCDSRAIIRSMVNGQRPKSDLADRVNGSRPLQDGILACTTDATLLLPERASGK